MKASELRLGNLVVDDLSENVFTISCIHSDTVAFKEDRYILRALDKINPHPLTEQGLMKFGFDKLNEGKFKKEAITIRNCGGQPIPGGKVYWGLVINGVLIIEQIIFVHQIQNLYFAIKGEELQIKES